MTLNNDVLEIANDEGQRMAVFTAQKGSPSAAALHLLADLSAESATEARAQEHAGHL